VRATTGFPVTVGTQLAIPVGSYVEGVIDKLTKGGRSGSSLLMHFTRLVYANGYTVAVEGSNTQAKALRPSSGSPELAALPSASAPNYALPAPQTSQLPTPPKVGPSIGTVVGVAIGATAAGTIAIVLLNRRHYGSNGVLFDTGWQFEMVLQSPLSVDAASVAAAAAVAAPTAQ
jgi:hypothetical protein